MITDKVSAPLSIRNDELFIEDCSASGLVEKFGSPIFVVSEAKLVENARAYKDNFEKHWPEGSVKVMAAVKANAYGHGIVRVAKALERSDAFVAAWLPGSEGAGVAEVLFGEHDFVGRLPFSWPRDDEQNPNRGDGSEPRFPFGHGLKTGS